MYHHRNKHGVTTQKLWVQKVPLGICRKIAQSSASLAYMYMNVMIPIYILQLITHYTYSLYKIWILANLWCLLNFPNSAFHAQSAEFATKDAPVISIIVMDKCKEIRLEILPIFLKMATWDSLWSVIYNLYIYAYNHWSLWVITIYEWHERSMNDDWWVRRNGKS